MPSPPVVDESKLKSYGEDVTFEYIMGLPELPILYQSWTSKMPLLFGSEAVAVSDTTAVVVYVGSDPSWDIGGVLSGWRRKFIVYIPFFSTGIQFMVLR